MIWFFNILALVSIALIVWWFWLSKPKVKRSNDNEPVEIVVENGVYSPAIIEAKQGIPLELLFLRKDPSPCAEKVVFGDLNLSFDLSLGQQTRVSFTTQEKGEHEFTCQMAMYRGKLVVN